MENEKSSWRCQKQKSHPPELEEPHTSGAAEARSDLQILGISGWIKGLRVVTNRNNLQRALSRHVHSKIRPCLFLSGTCQKTKLDYRRHIFEIQGTPQISPSMGMESRPSYSAWPKLQNFIKLQAVSGCVCVCENMALPCFASMDASVESPLCSCGHFHAEGMIGSDFFQVPKLFKLKNSRSSRSSCNSHSGSLVEVVDNGGDLHKTQAKEHCLHCSAAPLLLKAETIRNSSIELSQPNAFQAPHQRLGSLSEVLVLHKAL